MQRSTALKFEPSLMVNHAPEHTDGSFDQLFNVDRLTDYIVNLRILLTRTDDEIFEQIVNQNSGYFAPYEETVSSAKQWLTKMLSSTLIAEHKIEQIYEAMGRAEDRAAESPII